jgi:phospholipase/carboxylesterase
MQMQRIENFDVIVKEGSSKTSIVVLHGYGASCQDLAPLHQFLDPSGHYSWYFVDAPLSIDIGFGMVGKAWFPIDMMGLQTAIQNGTFEKVFSDHQPEGMDEVVDKLIKLVEAVRSDSSEVFLGGFSQGSMMSLAVTMKRKDLVDKLFLLSSTLYDEDNFVKSVENLKNIKTFQSHGQMDPVLPYKMAEKLNSILKDQVTEYEFHPFAGQHEIPMDIIQKLKLFLER